MARDARVMATLGGVQTDSQVRDFLQRALDHWDRYGYGVWILTSKSTGAFVGRALLRNVNIERNDEIELGYAVMPEFWKRGLATEVSQAILKIAFENLHLAGVIAFTLPTNHASRRVMEKLGMKFERNITWSNQPHVLYRITRPDSVGAT
jgi:RimJ/RimL family protein N-acetyltransferase